MNKSLSQIRDRIIKKKRRELYLIDFIWLVLAIIAAKSRMSGDIRTSAVATVMTALAAINHIKLIREVHGMSRDVLELDGDAVIIDKKRISYDGHKVILVTLDRKSALVLMPKEEYEKCNVGDTIEIYTYGNKKFGILKGEQE